MNRRRLRRLWWNLRYINGRCRGTAILRRQLSHLATVASSGPVIIKDSMWGLMTIDTPEGYVMTSSSGERRESLVAKRWVTSDRDHALTLTALGREVLVRHRAVQALFAAHYR